MKNIMVKINKEKYVDEVLSEYFPDTNYKGIFLDIGAYEPIIYLKTS